MQLSDQAIKTIAQFQCNELTESIIYEVIARRVKDAHNRETLLKIAAEEKAHAAIWKSYSKLDLKPNRGRIFLYTLLARVFGYTFAIKLMERGEDAANNNYSSIIDQVPAAQQIAQDEQRHETELIAILDEERLQYVGSMVLGLSDALVELTGTLAGLSFAMQNTRLIALSGLITGIAASLSMASSEYLSAKSDGHKNPLKSAMYTGIMYVCAVVLLVLPYLLYPETLYLAALFTMLGTVILVIFVFTYYISVAKDYPFRKRFLEMAGISLGVAALSFVIGILVKQFLGIDI